MQPMLTLYWAHRNLRLSASMVTLNIEVSDASLQQPHTYLIMNTIHMQYIEGGTQLISHLFEFTYNNGIMETTFSMKRNYHIKNV